MKAVIQRVLDANLKVDGKLISQIGQGYVVFLGVKKGDTKEDAEEELEIEITDEEWDEGGFIGRGGFGEWEFEI